MVQSMARKIINVFHFQSCVNIDCLIFTADQTDKCFCSSYCLQNLKWCGPGAGAPQILLLAIFLTMSCPMKSVQNKKVLTILFFCTSFSLFEVMDHHISFFQSSVCSTPMSQQGGNRIYNGCTTSQAWAGALLFGSHTLLQYKSYNHFSGCNNRSHLIWSPSHYFVKAFCPNIDVLGKHKK